MQAHHLDPAPGSKLGEYVLDELVGSGGCALVYRARHVNLGRTVALKLLHGELRYDAELNTRFLREGRSAVRVVHENVVSMLDVGQDGDVAYLVMEWLEGEDAATWIGREGAQTVQTTLEILIPICSAVASGHRAGVIHRDVKLENIFLDRSQHRVTPKLLDFGVSKSTGSSVLTLNHRDTVVGTPQYMAPEQARGEYPLGEGVDQHALAVVAYVMLSGQFPRQEGTAGDVLYRVAFEGFCPLLERAPGLPSGLAQVVERGMATDATQRYPSVDAFAAALLEFAPEMSSEWGAAFGSGEAAHGSDAPPASGSRPAVSGSARVHLDASPHGEPEAAHAASPIVTPPGGLLVLPRQHSLGQWRDDSAPGFSLGGQRSVAARSSSGAPMATGPKASRERRLVLLLAACCVVLAASVVYLLLR